MERNLKPHNPSYVSFLITGGTGSLGTALTRRFLREGVPPQNITLLARNETKLNASRVLFPGVRCESGDVRDLAWLQTIFPGHSHVIHAGALKVVPTAEVQVRETVTTNVIGSMNVAMAAVESGVQFVVGVSSDKATQSSTIYGSSKFLMEGIFREANGWSSGETRFNTVRYGNVLGSNASVLPYFQSQVRQGKPLTVTMFSMTRFWLSMQEATQIINDAIYYHDSGVVLVPKAKASDMYTLAKAVAPHDDYPIVEIGRRPGEKVHEKMIHSGEAHHTKDDGNYFVIYHPADEIFNHLPEDFEYTSKDCDHYSLNALREKIREVSSV